jgi:hypothetical protein
MLIGMINDTHTTTTTRTTTTTTILIERDCFISKFMHA